MPGSLELSDARLAIAERRLLYLRPGGRIAEAQRYGIDLSLLMANLRLTPAERVHRMHDLIVTMNQVRGAARRRPE
jgi:hypothetical protein